MWPRSPEPDIQVELGPGELPAFAAVVSLNGEHDLAENMPIDLGECSFVDSTVISTLLSASRELEREGHRKPRVLPEIGWMDVGAGIGVGRRDVVGGRGA